MVFSASSEALFDYFTESITHQTILLTPSVVTSNYAAIVAGIEPSRIPSVENMVIVQLEPRDSIDGFSKVQNTQNKLQEAGYRAPIYSDVMESSSISQSSRFDDEITSISSNLSPNELINIQFTSGTTGLPKAVGLSHINVVNNARNVAECLHLQTAQERVCIPVPMYHCFGIVMGSLACVATANTAVFPAPTFSARATLQSVARHRCTALYGVPTMFINELAELDSLDVDLSSLRTGIMAGSICPEQVMRNVMSKMHMSQVTIA